MYYSKEAVSCMRQMASEEAVMLMSHYLDKYFDDYEEPDFSSIELKKIWFLLLYDGLICEIARNGEHKEEAIIKLSELVNANAVWLANGRMPSGKEIPLKTLKAFRLQQEKGQMRTEQLREFKRKRRADESISE